MTFENGDSGVSHNFRIEAGDAGVFRTRLTFALISPVPPGQTFSFLARIELVGGLFELASIRFFDL